MTDDEQHQTEPLTMSERLRTRGSRSERQQVNFERLFGPPPDTATDDDTATDSDGVTDTDDGGDDAA